MEKMKLSIVANQSEVSRIDSEQRPIQCPKQYYGICTGVMGTACAAAHAKMRRADYRHFAGANSA